MTDTTVSFTPEQLADQNKANLTAFILTGIAYQQEHGHPVEEYVQFVGRKFAPGWENLKDQPLADIARAAAINLVATGATLRRFAADDNHAEFVLAGWPPKEDLAFFGVTRATVAPFFNIFKPIAEYAGLHYEWSQAGDEITMIFTGIIMDDAFWDKIEGIGVHLSYRHCQLVGQI